MLTWDQYAQSWAALHGGVDPRHARPEVRHWVRFAYEVGRVLTRLRVPPVAVTAAALLLGVGTPVLAVRHAGWPALAAVLVVVSAAADGLDGTVALLSARTTPLGYVYDALSDRLVELCWLLALWLVGAPGWLVSLCLAVAWLHEYVRARAVGAGMGEVGAVTLAERPTRMAFAAGGLLVAALGVLFSPAVSAGAVTLATAVWVLVGLVGLIQLLVAVVRTLGRSAPPTELLEMPTEDLAVSAERTLPLLGEPD